MQEPSPAVLRERAKLDPGAARPGGPPGSGGVTRPAAASRRDAARPIEAFAAALVGASSEALIGFTRGRLPEHELQHHPSARPLHTASRARAMVDFGKAMRFERGLRQASSSRG